ncbi:polymer-forming cytoskeletal protein [Halanaerocella petrolearia]
MFNKKQSDEKKIGTVISQGTVMEGEIRVAESIRIDGRLNGKLIVEGDVFVGQEGKLTADIKAQNVMIAGFVEGNVKVKDKLEIVSTGKLAGDISMSNLVIHDGGVFEGSSTANLDHSESEIVDDYQEDSVDVTEEEDDEV